MRKELLPGPQCSCLAPVLIQNIPTVLPPLPRVRNSLELFIFSFFFSWILVVFVILKKVVVIGSGMGEISEISVHPNLLCEVRSLCVLQ